MRSNPSGVAEIQPVIDAASGRTPAAATIEALDTLDKRIKDHLRRPQPIRDHSEDADTPWSAPAAAETSTPASDTKVPGNP